MHKIVRFAQILLLRHYKIDLIKSVMNTFIYLRIFVTRIRKNFLFLHPGKSWLVHAQ